MGLSFFFLMLPPPPRSTLLPYTTLIRSIAVGALAPALWQPRFEGQALASTAVSPTASPMPPSWKGKDRGSGFVVCAKNDSWSRPTVAEENAHLAADPATGSSPSPASGAIRAPALRRPRVFPPSRRCGSSATHR